MSILFAILIFSFLIFIHEFGHFITAKLSGVQVNEFSMFMGPVLWKKQKGETLYSIRCIPFGGFCAMEGEDGDSDNPRAFGRAAWWKRLMILAAGAFMNLVAGILLFVIVCLPMTETEPVMVVENIQPSSSLAVEGGFQNGDHLLEMDGEPIQTPEDFDRILESNPGEIHDFVLERDGQQIVLDDFVFSKKIFDGEDTPRYGFQYRFYYLSTGVPLPLGEKLAAAWDNVVYSVKSVWMALGMLIRGEAGLSDMSGPVGIVHEMGAIANASETAGTAVLNLLTIGGFLAINLAVMNLLPIPALDGGRIVALLLTTGIEAVTHKKLNPKYEGYIHGVGMLLLLALMAVIMLKDIIFIFK